MDGNNQHLIYEDLLKNSKRFFRDNKGAKARTSANLIENLSSYSETIETFANKAYPVIHESMISLIETFLNYKLQNGSSIEKDLYKDISVTQFIDRLISKRPLAFLTTADSWLTREGEYGAGGWGEIGTEMEGETYKVLKLENFMSYDEIKLAAMLQLSSPVVLINNGSRDNVGLPGGRETFLDIGVYVGVVGARFEMAERMEYQDMFVTREQNTERNGYGENYESPTLNKVFAQFYGMRNLHEYSEVKNHNKMYKESQPGSGKYLNVEIYTKRIQLSAETFLLEAEHRGKEEDRDIYCHVVGLGLGVWQITSIQNKYFLLAWARALGELSLKRVKTVNFSWIAACSEVPELEDKKHFKGVKILFSRRNPFDLLPKSEMDRTPLVVAMFAWDGNSFVGENLQK